MNRVLWIPLCVFFGLWLNGAILGLSDDEAYYWVLAQRPAFGYAYHPPMVAWLIAAAQWIFGKWFGVTPALVRLPAAACSAGVLALSLKWLKMAGAGDHPEKMSLNLLSFWGFFALSWMIVPDSSLFLGWMLSFVAVWELCFVQCSVGVLVSLFFGLILCILSKYSGILVVPSAFIALMFWAPRNTRVKAIAVLVLALAIAATPILVWNASHDWVSILYQVHERHAGSELSWTRYAMFWIAELLLLGPALLVSIYILLTKRNRVTHYLLVWTVPGCIFLLQPLFSEFKLHWAFIVWFPLILGFSWADAKALGRDAVFQIQRIYGLGLGVFIAISLHFPLVGYVTHLFHVNEADPRWDVTNDFYGWPELGTFFKNTIPIQDQNLPILGSRYQTAAQVSFALKGQNRATMIPMDPRLKDEWPDFSIADRIGPDWPHLRAKALFVTDNRYSSPPEFPGASCHPVGRFEKYRFKYLAKWIQFWICKPSS